MDSKLNPSSDLHSTRQKHKDDLTGNDDSDDAHSTLSDNMLRANIKKETEERESPARRVTRNSSGTRGVARSRASVRSIRSPTRGSSSKVGGAETGDDEQPHRLERETRQSSARARLEVALQSDPPVIEDVRSSLRVQSAVKTELSETAHPPCLHFESDPSEVSSQFSQLLSRPEIRAKEKEVSNIFAWKLVPDELQAEAPLLPSFIYGAHHLLRLFGSSSFLLIVMTTRLVCLLHLCSYILGASLFIKSIKAQPCIATSHLRALISCIFVARKML